MATKKKTSEKTKCTLTAEQQSKVLGFAQMFLHYAKGDSGQIFNIKTNKAQSAMEYANEVIAALGIEAKFLPPPPVRDIKTLRVVGAAGSVLPAGRVSRDLERQTRRKPDDPAWARLSGGYWKPDESGMLVKVVAHEADRAG